MNTGILTTITIVSVAVIIAVTLWAYLYIKKSRQDKKLQEKRRWIEQLPSLVSTLGVLGTFLGITIGLVNFNPNVLDESIPLLLDGLKTAFFTSLTGMVGSLILSRYVSSVYDDNDKGMSDINIAAGEIVKAVKQMSDNNEKLTMGLLSEIQKQSNNQTAFYNTALAEMQRTSSSVEKVDSKIETLLLQSQSQTTSLNELGNNSSSMLISIGNIEANGEAQKKSNAEMINYIGEIVDATSAMVSTDENIAENVKSLGTKLHDEVVEIEDKMNETNVLLSNKFDEFTELLKKSNTEALVEVMKKVTEEFQKQMNSLINKLIQENFDQLNKSVEKLNQWQQENKEMISSLTSQYKQMATEFEGTSTTLTAVGNDTKNLVSDGGKLKQLIESLSKVLIEDDKFVEITKKLEDTVDLTKNNMTEFDQATRSLNEWVRKQRNFVDGVTTLITKLEELNKIKDYNEQFWQGTKRSLEEGVGIITEGSKSLNAQLKNLDAQFYTRLSATLAELDTCIQAMVNKK